MIPVTEPAVWDALRRVTDPELPISLVDLGLIYGVAVDDSGGVALELTFTSIGCPGMDMILEDIRAAIEALPGVARVAIEVVWSPPWTKRCLTEAGRRELQLAGLSL
ncbi:MAG: metal-sulfur cluster assembly factor [Gemmatimonadota bacterium]